MIEDIEEIALDELERRLREQWIDNAPPRSALADEDRAVAEKLLGRYNARRLAETPAGARFRPRKVVRTGEYIRAPAGWTLFILLNGRRRAQLVGLSRDRLDQLVVKLRDAGIRCRPVVGEDGPLRDDPHYQSSEPGSAPGFSDRPFAVCSGHQKPSKRFAILQQIGKVRA